MLLAIQVGDMAQIHYTTAIPKPHIERLTLASIPAFISLKREDAEECHAGGMTPKEALCSSVRLSKEAWVAFEGTEPIYFWGYRYIP